MKGKKKYFLMFLAVMLFLALGLRYADTKLTYKEYKDMNTAGDSCLNLVSVGEELTQEFVMPYDILDSIAVMIGTFDRDNNSTWNFYLTESDSGKIIYNDQFHASLIGNHSYYQIQPEKRIKVEKGKKYTFTIRAADVSEISALAFYVSNTSQIDGASLYYNGQKTDMDMCFKIYGGDTDYWWHGFICAAALYMLIMIGRACYVSAKGRKPAEDKYLQAMLAGAITFVLLCAFSVGDSFTDEKDNMRGGMVIADGGVLYKDYVTQHTPVLYYLCAVFALFGAGSVAQFRLSYYFLEMIIWALVYARNVDFFGKKKMLLLPVLEVVCVSSVVSPYGSQILSDGWLGILLVVMMLEFIRYCQDKKLGWDRSIIVSICIWGGFGAVFLSAYAFIWVALAVFILEIKNWQDGHAATVRKDGRMMTGIMKAVVGRYYRFLIALLVPFTTAVAYFKFHHSLRRAFDQFYTFNREVYPKYKSGLGENIAQPFVNGVQNFFSIIADNFNAVVTATASNVTILQLVIMVGVVAALIRMFEKKKYIESITLLFVMVFSAARNYMLHGIAAWYIALLIIAINIEMIQEMMSKAGKTLFGVSLIVLLSTYVVSVGDCILYKQESISELESQVIALTENDENKRIFLDAYCCDSLYFFYKGRKPVNAAVYMLPWYMDWYEKDDISALKEKRPGIVVYDEDRTCWEYSHYTIAFENELTGNYTRLGDAESGWKHSVWVRNTEDGLNSGFSGN